MTNKKTKIKDLILDQKYQVMPEMSEEDRQSLKEEIQKNNVQVNIEIDESMHVLDGFNRVEICKELGIEEVPTTMKIGMTEDEKMAHARALNIARRHLNREQKQGLIQDQLKETPERSDRQIASDLGVSHTTVGIQRNKLEEQGQIKHIETVTDTKGREQPREHEHSYEGRYSPEELERVTRELEGFDNDPFANLDTPRSPATVYNPSKREIEAMQDPDIAKRTIENGGDIASAIREHTRDELVQHLESVEAREIKQAEGVYDVLTIDPPWPMQKIETDKSPTQCAFDYPTMSIQEIKDMHIPAAENCHVFLWTTQKFLPDAFDILKAWGVKYVCEFVWNKGRHGMKAFNLPIYNCEFVLYGHIGSPKFVDEKDFYACFSADPIGHSIKPDTFYDMVRRVTAGRRLDMFNRREIEGFEVWGKESSDRTEEDSTSEV